jgi:hypothetical protein
MKEKRYWTSRWVVVPERALIDHILSDDPTEALKIAFAAANCVGATLGRCQMFWRQELGACGCPPGTCRCWSGDHGHAQYQESNKQAGNQGFCLAKQTKNW